MKLVRGLLVEILYTLEALARLEVVEVGHLETLMLVDPPSHIFLPFGDRLMRIVEVAIGLSIRVDVWLVTFALFAVELPPIIDALKD